MTRVAPTRSTAICGITWIQWLTRIYQRLRLEISQRCPLPKVSTLCRTVSTRWHTGAVTPTQKRNGMVSAAVLFHRRPK